MKNSQGDLPYLPGSSVDVDKGELLDPVVERKPLMLLGHLHADGQPLADLGLGKLRAVDVDVGVPHPGARDRGADEGHVEPAGAAFLREATDGLKSFGNWLDYYVDAMLQSSECEK